MKGSLEMTISTEENQKKIVIHVLKCKHLPKTTDIPHVNAYVKCAMVTLNSPSGHHNTYQRTAVHKNSTEPVFDHKFNFDLNNSDDHEKYLQLAVWHRNRSLKRSEFIGCLTVSVKNILEKNIEGTFKLQPQSFLLRPAPLIVEIDDSLSKHEETFQRIHEENNDNLLLRYLELSNTKSCGHHEGRTPFTLTRIIKKSPEDAFGFEISWSKPPKINSVKTLSKSSGLEKGDFIIFVGDTNIVAMQKEEIINLIRAQGNILTLEIFRSTGQVSSREIIEKLASKNTPTVELNHSENLKLEKNDLIETPRSHKISHFKQPQVCFQPTIGSGVIV
ncbi:CLUMA_CG010509, isoform A [Clunio marinus]|uniref:CLUMA_CG010509, isoform A n=1 Tax=Clunio marinus TaxID=568069 RepID=A0A1J1IA73_9DIPT|nr:CLUMA_CG010509, isoform A [Clunio marinus]